MANFNDMPIPNDFILLHKALPEHEGFMIRLRNVKRFWTKETNQIVQVSTEEYTYPVKENIEEIQALILKIYPREES